MPSPLSWLFETTGALVLGLPFALPLGAFQAQSALLSPLLLCPHKHPLPSPLHTATGSHPICRISYPLTNDNSQCRNRQREEAVKESSCQRDFTVLSQKVTQRLAAPRYDVVRRQPLGAPQNEKLSEKESKGDVGAQGFQPLGQPLNSSVLFTLVLLLCPARHTRAWERSAKSHCVTLSLGAVVGAQVSCWLVRTGPGCGRHASVCVVGDCESSA